MVSFRFSYHVPPVAKNRRAELSAANDSLRYARICLFLLRSPSDARILLECAVGRFCRLRSRDASDLEATEGYFAAMRLAAQCEEALGAEIDADVFYDVSEKISPQTALKHALDLAYMARLFNAANGACDYSLELHIRVLIELQSLRGLKRQPENLACHIADAERSLELVRAENKKAKQSPHLPTAAEVSGCAATTQQLTALVGRCPDDAIQYQLGWAEGRRVGYVFNERLSERISDAAVRSGFSLRLLAFVFGGLLLVFAALSVFAALVPLLAMCKLGLCLLAMVCAFAPNLLRQNAKYRVVDHLFAVVMFVAMLEVGIRGLWHNPAISIALLCWTVLSVAFFWFPTCVMERSKTFAQLRTWIAEIHRRANVQADIWSQWFAENGPRAVRLLINQSKGSKTSFRFRSYCYAAAFVVAVIKSAVDLASYRRHFSALPFGAALRNALSRRRQIPRSVSIWWIARRLPLHLARAESPALSF